MITDSRLDELLSTTAVVVPEEPEPEAMSDDEFQAVVRRLVENARTQMDEEGQKVERAWRYLNGEVDQPPMGLIGVSKETGETVYEGSSTVLTECWDQVQMLLPEIYRALAGSEEAVTFKPEGPEDTAYVEQANDYVRHLFWGRNDGEALVKDGLLEWLVKFAAVRVWREESHKEHVQTLEDLDETQLFAIRQDGNVEIEAIEGYQVEIPVPQARPDGGVVYAGQPQTLYRAVVRYREPIGKTRVQLIPQDELLVDLEAQNLDEATVLGIDAERRASDLIAMGLDPEMVDRLAGQGLRRASRGPGIRRARGNEDLIERTYRDTPDHSLWWVRTVDARVLVDRDGDGIAEPWRVIALGEPLEIAAAVEDPGSDTIVMGSPFPRPHRLIGDGLVEKTMDLQEIGTSIVRRTLDNFARSINPRMVIYGSTETMDDDVDSWFGGPVHLGANSKVDWLQVPFNGNTAMPLLQFFGDRRTLRTGISPASMGLDPNALKGQTVDGAGAIVAAPQSRAEGLAREFASRIMGPLFKAILKITAAYQDKPEVIRLRNEWVTVDPRSWNRDMDVAVEVGTGSRQERIAGLLAVIAKQELLLTAGSPLSDLEKYHRALADLTHEMGTKDDERYFTKPDEEKLKAKKAEADAAKAEVAQQAVMVQQATEQAKAQAEAQGKIAVEQVKGQLEQAAKARELALEDMYGRRMVELETRMKQQLLQVEAALEARLSQLGVGGAAANANIGKQG